MAWDAPRHSSDGLPAQVEHLVLRVDEVKINNSQSLHVLEEEAKMCPLLSPIHEEARALAAGAPLQVTVTVRFHDPVVRSVYARTYLSSQSFRPTERICRGLLRRINHCSEELLTRRDADALNPTQCVRKGPKQLRLELTFEIHRQGCTDSWGWSHFRSYQKSELNRASVKEVVRSTHSIIGLFLQRHDRDFQLTTEPLPEHFADSPEMFKPSATGHGNLACVPRARFIESTQSWEFVPGYSLDLVFKSSNPARQQSQIVKTLKIDSHQTAPLHMGLGEDLLWQTHRSLEDLLDQKKKIFDLEHASCDGFDGVLDCDCQRFEEKALQIELHVKNNLGPTFDHLSREIHSRLRLFSHPTGQDCDDFIRETSERLGRYRDAFDKKMEALNDFDFRVLELTGHGWQMPDCVRLVVDGKQNHSRRTIEALLSRLQSSVRDVLRGFDVAIHMVAYKRGHLVMDKALVARHHRTTPLSDVSDSSAEKKDAIIAELRARIDKDIKMVCEDTCSLDEEPASQTSSPRPQSQQTHFHKQPGAPSTPRSFALQPLPWTPPGSPGSFATRPPTPPQVPPRSSSVRVFPLVPAKYRLKKQRSFTETSTTRDSAVAMGLGGEHRALSLAVESQPMTALKVPPSLHEPGRDCQNINGGAQGLQPAAEVYSTSKTADSETDSNSTHSSLPALTEGGSPSPESSMLITPSFIRSTSPSRPGMQYYGDSFLDQPSSPLMSKSSVPRSPSFSDAEFMTRPKFMQSRPVRQNSQPISPVRVTDAEDLKPSETPKALLDCGGDEKTPLAPRPTHGLDVSDCGFGKPGTEPSASLASSVASQMSSQDDCSSEADDKSETSWNARSLDSTSAVEDGTAIDRLHAQNRPDICRDEVIPADEAEHSDALLDTNTGDVLNEVSRILHLSRVQSSESEFSAASIDVKNSPLMDTNFAHGDMMPQDNLSRTKPDFFEQDEDDVNGPETTCCVPDGDSTVPEAEMQPLGMSETSEDSGHVMLLSGTGADSTAGSEDYARAGPESDDGHISDHTEIVSSNVVSQKSAAFEDICKHENANAPEGEFTSGPEQDQFAQPTTDLKECSDLQAPVLPQLSLGDHESLSLGHSTVPITSSDALTDPKNPLSGPTSGTPRPLSIPSAVSVGLGSHGLLPALPIMSNLTARDSNVPSPRDSWCSSSSWEDVSSTGRHSSDSVDTIKPSPNNSDIEEAPESPKRLGTPTAGLLGLHESRWAELGLRSALTGTHAFDRPSTAPLLLSPEVIADASRSRESENTEDSPAHTHTSPVSSHKSVHLRHKASIGSILTGRLPKKDSQSPRRKKSTDFTKQHKGSKSEHKRVKVESSSARVDDDSAGRFPRAMMLVAGLAFASSVVNRNHS